MQETLTKKTTQKRYDAYKDSGVKWLGEIPKHWEVRRLKYFGEAIIGLTYNPSEMTDAKNKNGILVFRSSNVQNGEITYDDCVYVTTKVSEKKITQKGDILICSRNGSIRLIGKNALIDEKSSNQTFGAFMTIFRSENYKYLTYFFNSACFKAQSGSFFTSTINQLTTGILNELLVATPKSLSEQVAITKFLDKKCEEIGLAISKKEELITLLKERKQILIQDAVTKGLDPKVTLKDSGIEWVGAIPEHWEVKKLKYLLTLKSIKTLSKKSELNYLGMENIESWTGKHIPTNSETDGLANCFNEGDILFGKLRPYLAKVYLAKDKGICSTEFLVYSIKKQDEKYFHKVMLSYLFINLIDASTYGSKMPRANSDWIGNQLIPLPPLSEQKEIAAHIEIESSKIEEAISLQHQQIANLKEYKATLINSAVTGKIKVCE